jgi:hypothetical protein
MSFSGLYVYRYIVYIYDDDDDEVLMLTSDFAATIRSGLTGKSKIRCSGIAHSIHAFIQYTQGQIRLFTIFPDPMKDPAKHGSV